MEKENLNGEEPMTIPAQDSGVEQDPSADDQQRSADPQTPSEEGQPPVPTTPPAPTTSPASQGQTSTSGLAVAGLVLGILAILGAFIPLLNIFTAPFAVVGLVLAIVGFMGIKNGKHTGKSVAVAGIVLGAVALVVTIGMYGCAGAVASHASSSSSTQASSATTEAPSATTAATTQVEFAGITFDLPSGWVAEDADNGGKYYYPSSDDQASLIHVLSAELDEGNYELNDVLEGMTSGLDEVADLKADEVTVSGCKAQRASFKTEMNGAEYSFRYLAIVLPGKVVMISGASLDGAYDSQIDAVLDSVQVVEAANAQPSSSAQQNAPASSSASSAPKNNGLIDADKFNAIKQGMSYEEVVSIIGSEGKLLSTSELAGIETSDYQWESDGWGTATVMFQNGSVVNKTQIGVGGSDAKVTLETFNALENGMSYEQVVSIIGGEGELVSETEVLGVNMAIYMWDGNGAFSNCTLTFQDGTLSSKSQYGLK